MKNHENSRSIAKTLSVRGPAALLADRRLCPFRYAVGLVALFVPLAQGCGDSPTCAMTATCRPSDKGDARSAVDTPDSMWDAGADDADNAADPDLIDGGSSARDSARDERSTSDGTGDGLNDGATRSDGGAETGAGGNNDGTPRVDAGSADRNDPVPISDAAAVTDATLPDAFADAPLDTPPDVPVCDASPDRSPLDEPCLVDEAYGAFVSPRGSDITGNGTRAAPYQTIGHAMGSAKRGRRVFVCDDGTGYSDPIVVDRSTDGHALYGAFDCATWVPSATARARVLPKAGPAIIVNGVTVGITVENFELRAADAAGGASSIAAKIDASVGVVFRRTRIASGKGGAGSDGPDGTAGGDGPPAGADQMGRAPFCANASQLGGVGIVSTCGATGGRGGLGTLSTFGPRSNPGMNGEPMIGVSPANRANAGTTCRSDTITPGVTNGSRGADGIPGVPGATAPSGGAFSATGYAPSGPGADGTDGRPAQGGGGGVGCPASSTCVGPSGGAGGAGGCGGQHGSGGGPAGASI